MFVIPKKKLLDIPVTCLPFEDQIMLMMRWAQMRASKAVCLANVHMLMEAYKNSAFANVLHKADLVTPDGKPLVMMLRRLGIKNQNQVAGLDVFLNLCDLAEQTGTKVYFLGSTNEVLSKIKSKLDREYPVLQVAGMKSPRRTSIQEILRGTEQELIEEIEQVGAGIVFVCLGCPKQEIWMSQYQGKINAVMVGVGAVFSMYAGINPRAPRWIQQAGLEWLYRLLQEPRRLWRRYGSTIPPFLYLATRQLVSPYKEKLSRARWQRTPRNVTVSLEAIEDTHTKLGKILVCQDVITRGDLETALLEQKDRPDSRLGEILVRRNLLSRSQLKFYLKNQNIRFGDFLIDKKILNRRSLNKLLRLQRNSNKKIGEIVLEQSILSEERLKELFVEYYTRRKGLFLATGEEINQKEKDLDLSSWVGNIMVS